VRIDVSPKTVTVERIEQRVYFVGAKDKRTLLDQLLADPAFDRVLVFTRTKRGADRVCKQLKQTGVPVDALHGNKAQNARVRALDDFRKGKVRVLVATDIAARGIDVPNISHVINYELPNEPESYVHRIGRTARAGAGGAALSFCDQSERPYLKAIEQLMQRKVTAVDHRLVETPSDAAVEAPRRGRPAQAPKDRRRGGNRTPHSSEASWTRTPHSSEASRTRTPHISEIPMLAAPTTKRGQVSRHSGGGHR
jgi:ATP-dependent RNA helicase RhlE